MKEFIKTLYRDSSCFVYIGIKMPGVNLEKLKARILDGLQIIQLISKPNFLIL